MTTPTDPRIDRLNKLLPAIYRMRDADQGYPLQALLRVIAEQANVVEDAPDWWARVEEATLAALHERGEATAQELGQDVPEEMWTAVAEVLAWAYGLGR